MRIPMSVRAAMVASEHFDGAGAALGVERAFARLAFAMRFSFQIASEGGSRRCVMDVAELLSAGPHSSRICTIP